MRDRRAVASAIHRTSTISPSRSSASPRSCPGASPPLGSDGPGPRCGRTSRPRTRWGSARREFKLLAFAIGGAIGSLGGALFAVKIGSLTPASFQVIVSIQVLGLVILGGMGSIPGVLVGALVLVGLPGLLREFEEYRLLAYGAAVVAVMILRPQGLIPNVRRSRELQDEERAQDEWAKAVEEGEPAAEIATATGATT